MELQGDHLQVLLVILFWEDQNIISYTSPNDFWSPHIGRFWYLYVLSSSASHVVAKHLVCLKWKLCHKQQIMIKMGCIPEWLKGLFYLSHVFKKSIQITIIKPIQFYMKYIAYSNIKEGKQTFLFYKFAILTIICLIWQKYNFGKTSIRLQHVMLNLKVHTNIKTSLCVVTKNHMGKNKIFSFGSLRTVL